MMVLNFTAELEAVAPGDAEYSGHAVGIVKLNGREVCRFDRLSVYLHDESHVAGLFAEHRTVNGQHGSKGPAGYGSRMRNV